MKIIKYNLCTRRLVYNVDPVSGLETNAMKDVLFPVVMEWNEANEQIAKREAYTGLYTIEDDGKPDPSEAPTQLDIIEAQVTYTALMTDTLLEEALNYERKN